MKNIHIRNYTMLFLSILFLLLLLGYFYYLGPSYTTDTINYIQMASNVKEYLFPYSASLSPGYPFLLGLTANLFHISIEYSLYFWASFFIIFSYLLINKITKQIIVKDEFFHINSFFVTIGITSNWIILKILVTAHADALFLIVLLLFFYFFYLWFKYNNVKWFIIASLLGCLSIWVKLNGLVLIPFLVVCYIIYVNKIDVKYIIFPIFGMLFSFFLFKSINGRVISHLNDTNYYKIICSLANYDLFFRNFSRSGNVFFSAFFSKSLTLIIPFWCGIITMSLLMFLFAKKLFFFNKKPNNENVFLLFSFVYWIFLILLEQYIGYDEITARTLFPSILSFLFWLVCVFKSIKKSYLKIILIILYFNLIYSFYFIYKLYVSDPYNSFNYVQKFEDRESVKKLIEVKSNYNFEDRIYTNKYRVLYYSLRFAKINNFPSDKIFEKGDLRKLDSIKFDNIYTQFCKNFKSKNSVALLFDYGELKKKDSCLINNNTKIFKIDNDILIVNLKDSVSTVNR